MSLESWRVQIDGAIAKKRRAESPLRASNVLQSQRASTRRITKLQEREARAEVEDRALQEYQQKVHKYLTAFASLNRTVLDGCILLSDYGVQKNVFRRQFPLLPSVSEIGWSLGRFSIGNKMTTTRTTMSDSYDKGNAEIGYSTSTVFKAVVAGPIERNLVLAKNGILLRTLGFNSFRLDGEKPAALLPGRLIQYLPETVEGVMDVDSYVHAAVTQLIVNNE